MAWNGSDGSENSTQRTPRVRDAKNAKAGVGGASRTSAPTARWLVALAIVVVGGGVAWLFVGGRGVSVPKLPDVAKVSSRIKEQRPATVALKRDPPEAVATSAPRPKPLTKAEKDAALLKEIRDKFGDDIPESLKATVYFLEHPPQKTFKVRSNADFLRHTSERQLAGVALVEPGTFFVTKPVFDESFDRDFQDALAEKIDINDDDSDETRAVKEGVTDLKKEIADICKREGKNPSEVMNEHAASMYELGQYQRDLETELDRIHMNPEYSDKDVEDFCEAANELLKSKGLAPIPHIDLTRRSLRINSYQRMAERKAERERAREEAKEN